MRLIMRQGINKGGMPERFNGTVWRTVARKGLVSSNLTPSANFQNSENWRCLLVKRHRNVQNIINLKNMKGFFANIEKDTLENENFRKVLYTSKHSQLVLMSLEPKEEIGMEVHADNDQFFRIEKGNGKCIVDGNEYDITDGSAIVVPARAEHNVINVSETEKLKLYTIYSPAHHKDGIVRKTKEEAEADSPEFDGKISE